VWVTLLACEKEDLEPNQNISQDVNNEKVDFIIAKTGELEMQDISFYPVDCNPLGQNCFPDVIIEPEFTLSLATTVKDGDQDDIQDFFD
tara:strand:+ start:326 stop:592 length:267 start_codon:yes stop_codon:yes gene_type:complete